MWVDESGGKGSIPQRVFGWIQGAVESAHQSGVFSYDEATLQQIRDDWREIEQECLDGLRDARYLIQVCPPGLDREGSGFLADAANRSGQAYLDSLRKQAHFAKDQAEKCERALGLFTESEAEATDAFRFFDLDGTGKWKGPL